MPVVLPRADATRLGAFRQALKETFGANALVQDDELLVYSYDATSERHWPDAAVIANTPELVQQAVALCATYHVPLIARGSGSNLSGGTLPILGGLVVSLAGMTRILRVDLAAREVTVEPGVINATLQAHLAPHAFFFPPDPASHRISSLGGNVAEGSGGPHCVKYGTTSHYVRALKVILANGQMATCPAEPTLIDWPGILTGSEGTLALFTELTLGILPKPPAVGTLLAGFDGLPEAVMAVSAIIQAQLLPSTLELLDKATLDTVRPFIDAGYPDCEAVLLIEVDGTLEGVRDQLSRLHELLGLLEASPITVAQSPAQADALMAARRAAYGAAARLSPHLWVQDVTVPRPRLAEMMAYVLTISAQEQIPINTVAHAGDGNLHPLIPFNPDDADEVARMKRADAAILKKAAELGGSITGEHGVGIDKLPSLPLMFNEDERAVMAAVRSAFDPDGILNPGKAVYPVIPQASDPGSLAVEPSSPGLYRPQSEPELIDFVRSCYHNHHPIYMGTHSARTANLSLEGLNRILDFDADNMTIRIQGGLDVSEIETFLHHHDLDFPVKTLGPHRSLAALLSEGWPNMLHMGYGPLKNWVLGVSVIDGQGRLLRYGRSVMKNVAGLDMPKLYLGSLGRLGLIVDATLRLVPWATRPVHLSFPVDMMTSDQLMALVDALNMMALGPQGLWLAQNQGHIMVQGPDLDRKVVAIRHILKDFGIVPIDADGVSALSNIRRWYTSQERTRQQEGGTHYFGVGRLPSPLTAPLLYHQPDGSGWISTVKPEPFQFFRSLDSHGWQVNEPLDSGLTAIQERLVHMADPRNLFTHLW
ncbi:MAG: FAD-binding protein [Sulfobacillus thermotolerans]|nr:FAD-binding protein [Sulfobacillus thermotolerans]